MYPFRQANVPPGVHAPQVGNPCTILLCLFTSKDDINGSRLNYSTVPSNIRLGICSIYKTSLLHRPVTILVSHQAAPPTFYNKIASMGTCTSGWEPLVYRNTAWKSSFPQSITHSFLCCHSISCLYTGMSFEKP